MKNINLLKYNHLIAVFEQENDPLIAIEICQMLAKGELKVSSSTSDNKTLFIVASKYRSKCIKCNTYYEFGSSIFVRNKKAWHLKCADDSDLELPYFKDCFEKGLVDDFDMRAKSNDDLEDN